MFGGDGAALWAKTWRSCSWRLTHGVAATLATHLGARTRTRASYSINVRHGSINNCPYCPTSLRRRDDLDILILSIQLELNVDSLWTTNLKDRVSVGLSPFARCAQHSSLCLLLLLLSQVVPTGMSHQARDHCR